jgi:hypothetical protein
VHDQRGLAQRLEVRHGKAAREAFCTMSKADRDALVVFLGSL